MMDLKDMDFKILGELSYGDFPLVEYMYNEIIIQDTYGLRKLQEKCGNSIKTILDIGGNLGVFSVYARELFPEARIISLEAVYDTYISLVNNVKNYDIEVYNMALGDGSTLFLKKCPDHSGANSLRKEMVSNIPIKSKTLDSIFEILKIESPYVIKMDIEGSEMFLYQDESCLNILRNCQYFTMEYHDVPILGYHVHKPEWDQWLTQVFVNHQIDGLGGNDSGATYRVMKK